MPFYSEFSKNYDKIFPVNSDKLELLDNTFKDLNETREKIKLLDVGCGTGGYTLALAAKGYKLKAVDIDTEMISLAESKRKKDSTAADFYRLGMLNLKEKFSQNSFDGIYIIGNVLVHLEKEEIKNFLDLTADLLKVGGRLFIQIINYNRILKLNLNSLAALYSRDNSLRFERNYRYDKNENIIHFKTKLIDQFEDNILSENEIELYPLFKEELENFLQESGFEIINFYGSPAGDQYRELKSIPLLLTAEKGANDD